MRDAIGASVSDIAKKAGIAKGGMYYYFRSKEEVLDALVERVYEDIIQACNTLIEQSNGNAIAKFVLLFKSYYSSTADKKVLRSKYKRRKKNGV